MVKKNKRLSFRGIYRGRKILNRHINNYYYYTFIIKIMLVAMRGEKRKLGDEEVMQCESLDCRHEQEKGCGGDST